MITLFGKLNYSISPQLLTNLSYINLLRGKISARAEVLSKKQLADLQKTNIIEISHYSTRIEGNNISFPLSQLYLEQERDIPAIAKDKQELKNTYNLIEKLKKTKFQPSQFSHLFLHKLQKQITKELVPESRAGQYREQQNAVKSRSLLVYMPPEAKDIEKLMSECIDFIKEQHSLLDPFLLSFVVHHVILLIHPYMDGNGRLSRIVQLLLLWNKGFGDYKIFSIDTECEMHLQEYYEAIAIGPNRYTVDNVDATKFLEFMSLMTVYAFEKTLKKISA